LAAGIFGIYFPLNQMAQMRHSYASLEWLLFYRIEEAFASMLGNADEPAAL
jgi:hypothetical protein